MPLNQVRSSLAETLKVATAELHQSSEAAMMPLLQKMDNREDYARMLATLYAFYAPLEKQIRILIDESVLPDIHERGKAASALKDLEALGSSVQPLHSKLLPFINNTASALGALYVLEGSTLGGRVITKMLKARQELDLQDEQLQFFSGYGEDTGPKWKCFVDALNRFEGNEQQVIDAANQTFLLFSQWLNKSHLYGQSQA